MLVFSSSIMSSLKPYLLAAIANSQSNNHFNDPELEQAETSQDELFSLLEGFEEATKNDNSNINSKLLMVSSTRPIRRARDHDQLVLKRSSSTRPLDIDEGDDNDDYDHEEITLPAAKKSKSSVNHNGQDDLLQSNNKLSHITVERNRRKQMNEHLLVLRSLMPCFYVKRGDQASIIGGVIDYIKELQQVLHSLEAKKQRKVISEVLSPRPLPSPKTSTTTVLSPRPPLLKSPRMPLPISPRTPQSSSSNKPIQFCPSLPQSPVLDQSFGNNELPIAANSKTAMANIEVKFSGPNILVKTVSQHIPGQVLKIVSALEGLALEILHVSISSVDHTMFNSFTIKIGIECELSAEELAQQIQQTFS